jgi:hypothetical protein
MTDPQSSTLGSNRRFAGGKASPVPFVKVGFLFFSSRRLPKTQPFGIRVDCHRSMFFSQKRRLKMRRISPEDNEFTWETPEQLEAALAHKSRSELIDLIYSLVTVEQLLKPAEIASRSCLNKRAVLRDIRDGKFGAYFCRAQNSIAVPASGVNKWRNNFRVPAKLDQEARR